MNMFNISFLRIEISTVAVLLSFFLVLFSFFFGSSFGGIRLLFWPQKPSKNFYQLLMARNSLGIYVKEMIFDDCTVCRLVASSTANWDLMKQKVPLV